MRTCWIVLAAAAAIPSAAMAEHPGRPANLPPPGSANLHFIDGTRLIRAFEPGAAGSVDIFVYGWSFDANVPDSPFVSSSPAEVTTNLPFFAPFWMYAYNGTTFTYDQLNVELLKLTPNANIGLPRMAMFDFSKLKMTNSIFKSEVISASDSSTVEFSNTQLSGELRMRSLDAMTLSGVTPFQRPNESLSLRLFTASGTTTVSSSTLDSIVSRGGGRLTVSNSTIRGGVSTDRGDLHPVLAPSLTLGGTQVESLSALIGSISMTGGRVQGAVNASGVAEDSLRAGSIVLDGVVVGGSVSASKFGSIVVQGGSIGGHVTVGDASDAAADLKVVSSAVSGSVQATGHGNLLVSQFQTIGPVQASGNSRVTISSGEAIQGHVFAIGKSQVDVKDVTTIHGDAFADQGARLSLLQTSANDVGAFADSTLSMSGGRARSVTASGGDVELRGVDIADRVVAFGKSNLTFSLSEVGGSITNFGDGTGLVRVESGIVGGDLVGLGRSVTAMSGGLVKGSPVFSEQATFLFSGGTFFFQETSLPPSPEERASFRSADGGNLLGLPATASGFTANDDAMIQFIGFGLQSTLVDADYLKGDIRYSVYQLTGLLADQSSIDGGLVFVQNAAGNARFELIEAPPVPEPSVAALLLLGLSGLGFARCKRRAAQIHRATECG